MFIGHFGLGFAGKKIDQRPSLGTLFLASQFIDLLWPVFLLLGLETVVIEPGNTAFTPLNFISYPYSHSFIGVVFWSVLFGGVYFLVKKNMKGAVLLGFLVSSHWILDLITHRPDLPLTPWTDLKIGLGLWNYVTLTVLLEGFIFLNGIYFYLSVTKPDNKSGKFGLWGLILLFLLIYATNLAGPPPPSVEMISYVGHAQWLFIAMAYWVDKNRSHL